MCVGGTPGHHRTAACTASSYTALHVQAMAAAPPPLDLAGGAEDLTVVPSALTVAQLQVE